MYLDIKETQAFYCSAVGHAVTTIIGAQIAVLMERHSLFSGGACLIGGVGYPLPYFPTFSTGNNQCLAIAPAQQGGCHWINAERRNASMLCYDDAWPVRDAVFDGIILTHALEMCEVPDQLLEECWRCLKDDGKLLIILPYRPGIWSRIESTPFGWGRPYSRRQAVNLLTREHFRIVDVSFALHLPPIKAVLHPRRIAMFDKIARITPLPAGVMMVVAVKIVPKPVTVRKHFRRVRFSRLPGTIIPQPAGIVPVNC